MPASPTVQATKAASELRPGDRIAAMFLPGNLPADVLFVEPYIDRRGVDWVFVAYREEEYGPSSTVLVAASRIPVDPADTGLSYSRADSDGDDPTPVSPARVPLHTGSVVDGGALVTDPELVTTYFSFGHGQTDPDTGENLLDKYVTVLAPSYEECRAAMFASRYGRAWSFDYLAGTPTADEWIPRWTEHDRIVVGPDPS
jgi:hypothetical protein